jgi:hypothetical protein
VLLETGRRLQLGGGEVFDHRAMGLMQLAVFHQRCEQIEYALNLSGKALFRADLPADEQATLFGQLRKRALFRGWQRDGAVIPPSATPTGRSKDTADAGPAASWRPG